METIMIGNTAEFSCPDGYEFYDENGNVINATKIVLEKKKKEVIYPQTYKECAEIIAEYTGSDCNPNGCMGYKSSLLTSFQKLLICRDTYWKIAGEEMGLGKSWEPDWSDYKNIKYIVGGYDGETGYDQNHHIHKIFAFPTEEMRDAFYENFKGLINECKELL